MTCPYCDAARELVDAERAVVEARAEMARRLLDLVPVWEHALALQREILDSLRVSLEKLATTRDDFLTGRVQ